MSTILQILVTLKAADATALTAREAIQSLLGFGDDLLSLHRFRCIETSWSRSVDPLLEPSMDPSFDRDLERYVDQSVELWNPNRERCWVRFANEGLPPTSWELVSGKGTRPGRFGDPDLTDAGLDHVVVTSLEPAAPTADFPERLGALARKHDPAAGSNNARGHDRGPRAHDRGPYDREARAHDRGTRTHYRAGEIFTTHWRSSGTSAERAERLRRIAEVRTRHEGLLVHPEFQDHLLIVGALPLPIWKDA